MAGWKGEKIRNAVRAQGAARAKGVKERREELDMMLEYLGFIPLSLQFPMSHCRQSSGKTMLLIN